MEHGDAATGSGSRSGAGTSIQVTALDGIVNVNSLFTLAAFLGLAWRPSSDGPGLADGADHLGACAAGDRIESDLVSFHVLAFACFLFSSLVALCLKQIDRGMPPVHGKGKGFPWFHAAGRVVCSRTPEPMAMDNHGSTYYTTGAIGIGSSHA